MPDNEFVHSYVIRSICKEEGFDKSRDAATRMQSEFQALSGAMQKVPMGQFTRRLGDLSEQAISSAQVLRELRNVSPELRATIAGTSTAMANAAESAKRYTAEQAALGEQMQLAQRMWRQGTIGRAEYKAWIDKLHEAQGNLLDQGPKQFEQQAKAIRQEQERREAIQKIEQELKDLAKIQKDAEEIAALEPARALALEEQAKNRIKDLRVQRLGLQETTLAGRGMAEVNTEMAAASREATAAEQEGAVVREGTTGGIVAAAKAQEEQIDVVGALERASRRKADSLERDETLWRRTGRAIRGATDTMRSWDRTRQVLSGNWEKHYGFLRRMSRGWGDFGRRMKGLVRWAGQIPARAWDRITGRGRTVGGGAAVAPRAAAGPAAGAGLLGGLLGNLGSFSGMLRMTFGALMPLKILFDALRPAIEMLAWAIEPLAIPFQIIGFEIAHRLAPIFAKLGAAMTKFAGKIMPAIMEAVDVLAKVFGTLFKIVGAIVSILPGGAEGLAGGAIKGAAYGAIAGGLIGLITAGPAGILPGAWLGAKLGGLAGGLLGALFGGGGEEGGGIPTPAGLGPRTGLVAPGRARGAGRAGLMPAVGMGELELEPLPAPAYSRDESALRRALTGERPPLMPGAKPLTPEKQSKPITKRLDTMINYMAREREREEVREERVVLVSLDGLADGSAA